MVSALAPYKRIDLAVEACSRLGRKLIVVGKGEEKGRLRSIAGPTVEIVGWRSDAEVARLMSRCRAFLLPGEEDFGITPLEASASGRPVVALSSGGVTETVVDIRAGGRESPTGVLFREPTVESLVDALGSVERHQNDFDSNRLRTHAARFARPRFRREIRQAIQKFAVSSQSRASEEPRAERKRFGG